MNITGPSCRDTCKNIEKCSFEVLEQSELAPYSYLQAFKKNESIFVQGETANGLFCVNSGKIKIVMANNEGKESIVRLVKAGDIIGHRALFSNMPYHASAIALEDSIVCFFNKDFIFNAIDEHQSVALKILAQISLLVGYAEMNNANLVHKNVRERLAGLLLTLKKEYGVREGNRIRLDINLNREDMAATIGTTHETLARLISEFRNEGIVAQEKKVIFIINEKKLVEFANI